MIGVIWPFLVRLTQVQGFRAHCASYKNANQNPEPVVREEHKIGRNEIVKISNGNESKEMKYKKAKRLIETGEWHIQ